MLSFNCHAHYPRDYKKRKIFKIDYKAGGSRDHLMELKIFKLKLKCFEATLDYRFKQCQWKIHFLNDVLHSNFINGPSRQRHTETFSQNTQN